MNILFSFNIYKLILTKYIDKLKDENILNCASVFKDFKEWDGTKSLRGLNINSVLLLFILMYIYNMIVNLLGAVFTHSLK